jgi:hypothetical protein
MTGLAPSVLLKIWEWGRLQPPYRRALALLTLAYPRLAGATLARLSIGQRDGLLLSLRERLFGPWLASVASCPRCGERVELRFSAAQIRAQAPSVPREGLLLLAEGFEVRFRPPNSLDLAALAGAPPEAGTLLRRCVLAARQGEAPCRPEALPPAVEQALVEAIAEADPQADVWLALVCPSCRAPWQAPFDVVGYLWDELDAWACRLLHEIHTLALAYGWREADVLALSPWRRRLYLEMLGV